MTIKSTFRQASDIVRPAFQLIRKYADAAVFFPTANLANFAQGGHPAATIIAAGNLGYSLATYGLSLLADPLRNLPATLLTAIGTTETLASLGSMVTGTIKNQAAPFVGVAAGTALFAGVGLLTGNVLGAMTGFLACAGELSLAIKEQQRVNKSDADKTSPSRLEQVLTEPLKMMMRRG
jgi:hypothetical protein